MLDGEANSVLNEIFDGLTIYAGTHFRTEEQYMFSSGFPDFEQHKGQHQSFSEKLGQLQSSYRLGEKQVAIELTNFLKSWLINHISSCDKILGKYLKAKGVA
jgi:hemerythrin-like metal-binding protein